ncbi:MAG: argininosuccinate lyase [Chloroflexota bacterium]
MTLWSGRFDGKLDPAAWQLNASLPVDQRLAEEDVRGSLAWAKALEAAGVLTPQECELICRGLERIRDEFSQAGFVFHEGDEDIHTAVERRLGEIIGEAAGKLHSGRSRNDQVATDFRLWVMGAIERLRQGVQGLQLVLVTRAEADFGVVMPGYTHLQRAQPILLSHWWLWHFWALQRDVERLTETHCRTAVLPLGSGALAGSPFAVDRQALAAELGFLAISENSLDGVSDRDFAAEFLFDMSLIGVHVSRLAEAVILYSSAEFGFFVLDDAYSTGSSLMPQKKNPDMFELARGQSGKLIGLLCGLLATLKGLPSAYDKDLQEDKAAVFSAFDTLSRLLGVLAGAVKTLAVRAERMAGALEDGLYATDLADYLVERGVPFRQAHGLVGQAVRIAEGVGVGLKELPLEQYQALSAAFEADLYEVFDPQRSVSRRTVSGGTAPQAVRRQLERAKEVLGAP